MKVSHKHFNHLLETNLDIISGNVISDAQLSMFVAKGETNTLPAYVPYNIQKHIMNFAAKQQINWYVIRHINPKSKLAIVHGYLVTADYGNTELVFRCEKWNNKTAEIMRYARKRLLQEAIRQNTMRANHAYERCKLALGF